MKARYKESEVIEAVIRTVSPSLKLKSYLEVIQYLTRELHCIGNGLFYPKRQINPTGFSGAGHELKTADCFCVKCE